MANTTDLLSSFPNSPRIIPIGLNFGPTSLSVAFFIDAGEYCTGITCGELYQSFWQDTLSKKAQHKPECASIKGLSASATLLFFISKIIIELRETFSEHITSAINMAIWALDNNPALNFKLIAVTVPDHWDRSALTHIATAINLAGQSLDGSHMIIPLSRAIQSAFQMIRYTKDQYLTLLLNYNKSYLHMILIKMCRTGCIVKKQVYFPHLGENELHKASTLSDTIASERESLTHNVADGEPSGKSKSNTVVPDKFITQRPICNNKEAHVDLIIDAVSEFMIQITIPSYSASELRHAVCDVRYVVIDGEASIPSLWDLRDAIKSKFINEEWINVEGDKRDCGAYGAAVAATRQLQNPKHLGDWKELPGYVPERLR